MKKLTHNQQHYRKYRNGYIKRSIQWNKTHKTARHKIEKKWRQTKTKRLHKYLGIVICPQCQTKGYLTVHSRQTTTTQHHNIRGCIMHYVAKHKYRWCHISRKTLINLLNQNQLDNPFPNIKQLLKTTLTT